MKSRIAVTLSILCADDRSTYTLKIEEEKVITMSDFELCLNQDEWLDVTPREELLQHELNMLKAELNQRSTDLDESELAIDLLKGHKELLEKERASLRSQLQKQTETLSTVSEDFGSTIAREKSLQDELSQVKDVSGTKTKELEGSLATGKKELQLVAGERASLQAELKLQNDITLRLQTNLEAGAARENSLKNELSQVRTDSENRSKELQDSLNSKKKELSVAMNQVGGLKLLVTKNTIGHQQELQKANKTIQSYASLVEDLKIKISSLVQTTKNQQAALATSDQKLKESVAQGQTLHQKLAEERDSFEQRSKELEGVRNDTGKIATFAEQLKEKTVSLERQLAQQNDSCVTARREKETASARESAVREEMAILKVESDQRIQELDAALKEEREQLEFVTKNQGNAADLKESFAREEALKEQLAQLKTSAECRRKELSEILGESPAKSFTPFKVHFANWACATQPFSQ